MKAAVIGPGSMGLLYGSRLSACADVCLVGRSRDHVDEMNENRNLSGLVLFSGMLVLAPFMAFGVNRASGFKEGFIQLTVMYMVTGLFDRIFIDWYWVGHTRAWIIPGTEDLMPYIGRKSWIRKIGATIIVYPAMAALISLIFSLF